MRKSLRRSNRSPRSGAHRPLIFLGDWSPDGATLPVYTFTQEQLAGLNLIPEGPVTYPPVALHFVESGSGRVCDYPRPALVGAEALAWLPMAAWLSGKRTVGGAARLARMIFSPSPIRKA